MESTDVITLVDSDEENTSSASSTSGASFNSIVATNGISLDQIPVAPRPLPGPSHSRNLMSKPRLPKKPGVFPPFALFSQEMRDEIMRQNPGMSFGDVGRKMGELWHALDEQEKESYRQRARVISDQKMKEYQAQLKKLTPAQRQQALASASVNASAAAAAKNKKKAHGFGIFSAEMRKTLMGNMPMPEMSRIIADKWRKAPPSLKQRYEQRAQRINQQRASQGGLPFPARQPPNSAVGTGSGLRISSVSSLSPLGKKRLPPSVTVNKIPAPVPNRPKLPSSITISRVEPEVSIVGEQTGAITVTRLPSSTTASRPGPASRKNAMAARARQRQNQQQKINNLNAAARNVLGVRGLPIPQPQSMMPNMRPRLRMQRPPPGGIGGPIPKMPR